MPATLAGARAKLTELKAKTDSATGYVDVLEDLLELIAGDTNEFGTAATENAGTAAGELAPLGEGGRFTNAQMPATPDFGRVLLDETPFADGDTTPRAAVTAAQLWRALGWALRPDFVLAGDLDNDVVGDGIAIAFDADLTTAVGTAILTAADLADYKDWRLRYLRPGQAAVQTVVLPNTLGDNTFRQAPGVSELYYRQRTGGQPRTLDLVTTDGTGWVWLSVEGLNPDLWELIPEAAQARHGLLSAADKTTLDSVGSGNAALSRWTFAPGDGALVTPGVSPGSKEAKLDGIEAGAQVNVPADWDATAGASRVLNKPTVWGRARRSYRTNSVNVDITQDDFENTMFYDFRAGTFTGSANLRFPQTANGVVVVQNNTTQILTVRHRTAGGGSGTALLNIPVQETAWLQIWQGDPSDIRPDFGFDYAIAGVDQVITAVNGINYLTE